jgi:hypothetical protein
MLILFIFAACDTTTGSDSDSGSPTQTTQSAPYAPAGQSVAEKAAKLAESLGADVNGDTVTLDVTTTAFPRPTTIDPGVNLIIPSGGSVDIDDATSLTVEDGGTLKVADGATLEVTGTSAVDIKPGSEVEISGTYKWADNAGGTNAGTIRVKAGGKLMAGTGTSVDSSSGTTIVEAGGEVYFEGETTTPFIGSDDSSAIPAVTLKPGAILTTTPSNYTLDGFATLNIPFGWAGITLTLTSGSVLTLADNAGITNTTVNGELGAQITTGTGATISGSNFYPTGTLVTGAGGLADKTYLWVDDGDGDGTANDPGWKEQ